MYTNKIKAKQKKKCTAGNICVQLHELGKGCEFNWVRRCSHRAFRGGGMLLPFSGGEGPFRIWVESYGLICATEVELDPECSGSLMRVAGQE